MATFADAWAFYPKRVGGNPRKLAEKAWDARVKQGANTDEMLAGTVRYAKFCEATGKLGTEYVKLAATFYGPSEWYMEPYDLPKPQQHKQTWMNDRAAAAACFMGVSIDARGSNLHDTRLLEADAGSAWLTLG